MYFSSLAKASKSLGFRRGFGAHTRTIQARQLVRCLTGETNLKGVVIMMIMNRGLGLCNATRARNYVKGAGFRGLDI